jgi:hypothetical protein|tara:strand:+ start:189 stop:701 length:513 start_codon:yes stop_codon:yes gene_type:complete
MMTMSDVTRYAVNKTESQYSATKNQATYELSLLGTLDRATRCERFIADQIEHKTGYSCSLTRPNWEWDITVELENKPVRIEVKSALYQKLKKYPQRTSCYLVQNVKPELFDYIFIVLITPEGTIEKWAKSKDIQKYCRWGCEGNNGYQMSISTSKMDKYDFLHDIEDFPL